MKQSILNKNVENGRKTSTKIVFPSFLIDIESRKSFVFNTQLYDGVEDCLYGRDEICAWKKNLDRWVYPLNSGSARGYSEFMDKLESNPAATRWYTMATEEEIEKLGHRYEVSQISA